MLTVNSQKLLITENFTRILNSEVKNVKLYVTFTSYENDQITRSANVIITDSNDSIYRGFVINPYLKPGEIKNSEGKSVVNAFAHDFAKTLKGML